MELDTRDHDVVKLLQNVKSIEAGYPPELLAIRRQRYIERVAKIGSGFGIASGIKKDPQTGNREGATTAIGSVFEKVLLVAIVAEAGAATYIYRDKIADFVRSIPSNDQKSETAPLPDFTSTELPKATETFEPTSTITSTTAPSVVPTIPVENNSTDLQAVSTPGPNGNNGNHYGQTPKPERTKDKGNNDNGNDGEKDKDR